MQVKWFSFSISSIKTPAASKVRLPVLSICFNREIQLSAKEVNPECIVSDHMVATAFDH
jgi:hypothetical protein